MGGMPYGTSGQKVTETKIATVIAKPSLSQA